MAGPCGPDVRWFCCVVSFVINNNRPPGLPRRTGLPTIRYRRGDGRGALMIPQAMGLTGAPASTPLPLSPHPGLMGRRGFRVGVMNDRDGWLGTKHVLTSSEYGATLQKGQCQGETEKGKKWASCDFQSFLCRLSFENVCVCLCVRGSVWAQDESRTEPCSLSTDLVHFNPHVEIDLTFILFGIQRVHCHYEKNNGIITLKSFLLYFPFKLISNYIRINCSKYINRLKVVMLSRLKYTNRP